MMICPAVGAPSSFRIVPVPCPSATAAFAGFARLTKNVSLASVAVSPLTLTVTVVDVPFAGME